MNTMWSDFAAAFVGGLTGACLFWPLLRRGYPSASRSLGADAIEILALAVGLSSSQIAFGLWPQLKHGISRYLVTMGLAMVIVLAGRFLGSRLRRRLA